MDYEGKGVSQRPMLTVSSPLTDFSNIDSAVMQLIEWAQLNTHKQVKPLKSESELYKDPVRTAQ
jgi:hypothetical protein